MAGDDQQIVLFGAVAANLAEGSAEAFGADPDRFGEDLVQVPLTKRKAAESGDRRLLAEQFLDLCGGVGHGAARLRCRGFPESAWTDRNATYIRRFKGFGRS